MTGLLVCTWDQGVDQAGSQDSCLLVTLPPWGASDQIDGSISRAQAHQAGFAPSTKSVYLSYPVREFEYPPMSDMRRTAWQRFILPITRHFRRRRAALLRAIYPEVDSYYVCDLGGSKHFWLGFAECVHPYRVDVINIAGEAINEAGGARAPTDERFHFEIYDGAHIERPDQHYDLLLCNSVIEHVPPSARRALALEMSRVAPRLFVQTPARAFPIDPHFVMPLVHWVPRPLGRWIARISPWRLMTRSTTSQCDAYFDETRLLTKRELRSLFPDGAIHVERILGLPKSYVIVCDRSREAESSS